MSDVEIIRKAGWDSKVRTEASVQYGNLHTFAQELGINPIPRHAMRVWSAIVAFLGSTLAVAEHLGVRVVQP